MSTVSGAAKSKRPLQPPAGTTSGSLLSASSSYYSLRSKKDGTTSSRMSGATAAAREEAKRRMLELRTEVEGAVHVLDGGVNRTPLPLQHRHSLVGAVPHDAHGGGGGGARLDMTQDSNATTALMNAELGASFLQSSFTLGSSVRSNAHRHSVVSVDRDGALQQQQRNRRGVDVSAPSMESSMQSLSFANDRHLAEQSTSVLDGTYRQSGGGGGGSYATQRGSNASNAVPRLVQQNTLLAEAAYARPPVMSAEKKAAWRRAITTITLSETPTVFLYSHHDEAVSSEDAAEVAAVAARNAAYAAVEEAFRTDEGTRFHSTGVATMRAPLKSIQTEVHPPAKKDSGALQVTPWMLKDAYVAALAGMGDDEDDDNDDPQKDGGVAGGDVEDALRDDNNDDNGDMDNDDQSSDAAQSTVLSSDEATTTAPSAAAAGAGGDGGRAGVESGKQWMLSDTLLSTLRIMERAVVQNYVEAAQLAYRGIEMDPASHRVPGASAGLLPPPLPKAPATTHTTLPQVSGSDGVTADGAAKAATHDSANNAESATVAEEAEGEDGMNAADAAAAAAAAAAARPPVRLSPDVRLLWRFGSSQLTRNRGVTCMTWNRREPDMLAVGYTVCRSATARNTNTAANNNSNGAFSPANGSQQRPSAQSELLSGAATANAVGFGGGGGGNGQGRDDGVPLKRSQGQDAYGMICCWSLKNPLAPELILFLRHEADVTALAFSAEHPSLLAVGSSTGEIAVFDIQRDVVFPSVAAAVGTTSGQHTGAVWELQWVPKGKEQGEFLTSISADGRVVQWAVGKAIERVAPDLMHLQRQPGTQVEQAFVDGVAEAEAAAAAAQEAAAAASGKRSAKLQPRPPVRRGGAGGAAAANAGGGPSSDDAVLSRQCGGMCFDVCPVDTAVYVVGTEDGSVLQCSKSQTENYDFEYEAHAELVYRVRWSPYSAAYFLTCSADWTARLYKAGTSKAQLRFNSVQQDAVQDVAWSPTNALIFATATARGSAEVWSVMDVMSPRASIEYQDHRHLSAVLFAEQETPVLVVGDEEGDVTVFVLSGERYRRQDLTDDEQEAWMTEAVRKQLT